MPQAPASTATAVPSAATAVPPTAAPTSEPSPPEGPALATDIANFVHKDVTVTVGTTVTWTNQDGAPHTVTSGSPDSKSGLWDSGRLSSGNQFSFTFDQPGSFAYYCSIHPYMTATVTVTGSDSSAALAPTPTTAVPPTATTVPEAATAVPPTPTPTPPAQAQSIDSDIANFALEDLTVNVGTKVTWTNRDGAPHTTTSGTPSSPSGLWNSGTLSRDNKFSFTFSEAGTFRYYCDIHNSMTGTVTVVASGAATSGQAPSNGATATSSGSDLAHISQISRVGAS